MTQHHAATYDSAGHEQVLYLTEPGDVGPISIADISPVLVRDQFLMAAIGEIAINDPGFIMKMIHHEPNGTDSVRLYTDAAGNPPAVGNTAFRPHWVNVSESFLSNSVNSGAGQDVVGGQKEIWPQVLEKAVATQDGVYTAAALDAAGGYSAALAMERLTGHPAAVVNPVALTLQELTADVAAHDLITFMSGGQGRQPFGLVPHTCYMLDGLTGTGAATTLEFWVGAGQPLKSIPFSALTAGNLNLANPFIEVDIGRL